LLNFSAVVKKFYFTFLPIVFFAFSAIGQQKQTALVKGKLINKEAKQVASEVQVTIPRIRMLTTSDGDGIFTFSAVPFGNYKIVIGGGRVKKDTLSINVNQKIVDLGDLEINYDEASTSSQLLQLPTIVMEDNDAAGGDDDGGSIMRVSSMLTASRDPFVNTAAFVFGRYRFQMRGYDRNQQQVLVNGIPVNDVETGDAYWSQWGGLNDVFRGRSSTYGLQPSDYSFGGVNGATIFDATAGNQRKQTRISYSAANIAYRNRLMLTHSSGYNKKGWAYTLSFSKRWAKEGYIAGTFYDAYSYYGAVSKKINNKNTLHFTVFGAPTKRGKSGPSYREAYQRLDNNFYNPNWGYQNGEKRNAKVADNHQPVFILNYDYHPSESLQWSTSLGYQFGKNKNSTLDWYNAPNPRPDYYKFLPSYYLNDPENYPNLTAEQEQQIVNNFVNNAQINWDKLYTANQLNGGRSLYVLGNDVDDIKKWTFNTTLQKVVNEHLRFQTGISFISQQTESYRQLLDLLGGDHYVNINSITERNYASTTVQYQNDLNHPDQIIKTGDKYYYDYKVNFLKTWWWGQALLSYNKVDFFVAANYGINSFQREGLFRNGLFKDDSYGKAKKQSFNILGVKGGATYKINGRHYVFVNAFYAEDAPTVDNTYFSSRLRNTVVDNPTTVKTSSIEAGYLLHAPKTNIRLVGYATDRKDGVDVQRFFYQGTGSSNSMVAYVMQNVNTRYTGLEFAVDYKFTSSFSANVIASVGQAFYTDNPNVTIHQENAVDSPVVKEVAYINNLYLGVGPQSAYTLGLNYRSKNYWSLSVNCNYFERNYIDPAAPRRTTQALDGVAVGSDNWNAIVNQEKLNSAFTVDLFASKSLLLSKTMKFLPHGTYLYLNVGINNLLDNKNVPTGGFENNRFDYSGTNPSKYASKYFFAYGRNFFINVSLKF
jgi:hypothetical protein